MIHFYNQFVNFIQDMHVLWFITIWIALVVTVLICTLKFFKIYNGEQKNFQKVSLIIIAVIALVLLVYLTYIRK